MNAELERRTAELNRLEGLQRGVLDTIGAALFIVDPELVVTHWNGSAERLWSLRSDAALGRELLTLPLGDMVPAARDALRRLKDTRRPERLGPIHAGGGDGLDGTMIYLSAIVSPAGALIGILGIATDPATAPDRS